MVSEDPSTSGELSFHSLEQLRGLFFPSSSPNHDGDVKTGRPAMQTHSHHSCVAMQVLVPQDPGLAVPPGLYQQPILLLNRQDLLIQHSGRIEHPDLGIFRLVAWPLVKSSFRHKGFPKVSATLMANTLPVCRIQSLVLGMGHRSISGTYYEYYKFLRIQVQERLPVLDSM